jgi:hypothetical protein
MRVLVLLAVIGLGACATVPIMEPQEWNANVTGTEAYQDARATARAVSGPIQTAVAINLAGGQAGGTHPWHIHEGTCASGGPIVGDADAYPMLRPGSAGTATATALVARVLVPGQNYHVNVHLSPTALGTIVACGNLR